MEHRLYPRRPLELDVIVRRQGRAPVCCRSRDACADGMFLALDAQQLGLKAGDAVELDLRQAGPQARVPKLCALVIHTSERGVGLLFSTPDALGLSTEQDLRALWA